MWGHTYGVFMDKEQVEQGKQMWGLPQILSGLFALFSGMMFFGTAVLIFVNILLSSVVDNIKTDVDNEQNRKIETLQLAAGLTIKEKEDERGSVSEED